MWQEFGPQLKAALVTYVTNTSDCLWRHDYKATTEVAFVKMLGEDGLYKVTMEAIPGTPVVRYRRLPRAALEATDLQPYMKTWTEGDQELTVSGEAKIAPGGILKQYVFHGSVLKLEGGSHLTNKVMMTNILTSEEYASLDLKNEASTVRMIYMGMCERLGNQMPFDELRSEFRHILDVYQSGEIPDIPTGSRRIDVSEPFRWISSLDGIHPPLQEKL